MMINKSVENVIDHYLSFLFDPLFYLVVALLVGEASLSKLGLPIDLMSSAMYLLVIVAIVLFISKDYKLEKTFCLTFLFYGYILLRNIIPHDSTFEDYWLPNLVTLVVFVIFVCIKIDKNQFETILKYLYGFCSVLMLIGVFKVITTNERLAVFGGPNGYYRFAMLFEALSYMYFIKTKKLSYCALLILGIFLAVMTGSKGAIVEILLIVPIELLYYLLRDSSIKKVRYVLILFPIACVVIAVAFVYLVNTNPTFHSMYLRGIGLFSGDVKGLTSVSARLQMLDLSKGYFYQNPIIGKGGAYMYYDTFGTNYAQPYAHNIFLEMLGEQGLLGFILFLIVLLDVLATIRFVTKKEYELFSLFIILLVYFVAAQFSGNILDSKMVFFSIILIQKYRKLYIDSSRTVVGGIGTAGCK